MNLMKYVKKRNFNKTPEPKTSLKHQKNSLNFCIQKHDASHLHYDFRLEYKGVLLSWAIPKGPSLNPKDKRLAIKVEDHPIEYQYFEGVIPKGNYGAGTVEIWDHGTYTVPNAKSCKDVEKALTQGLKKGHFEIILSGDKINGLFVFQQLKTDNKATSWLLIKKNEINDVTVKSGIPINENHSKQKIDKLGKKALMPDFIAPMLAISMLEPFEDAEWLFELKWDGFRCLAIVNPPLVQLKSRSKQLLNDKFKPIEQQLKSIRKKVIFDGELVVLDRDGMPKFQLMQNYQKTGEGNLYYYVFDLLYKDDRDLRLEPLIVRKKLLKEYLEQLSLPLIRYSDHVLKNGKSFFKEVVKHHIEGMMAKKISSTYQSRRSHDWIKIKAKLRQEFVIGGFTAPRGSRKKFGALLVGVYEGNKLKYAGHVGGGFNSDLLNYIYLKLEKLIQKKSPFEQAPIPNAQVTWVKPKLLCEVSFAEWTKDNIMRQPIFQGLRDDKVATKVKKETPTLPHKKQENPKLPNLVLTNQDKIYWPHEGITKGEIVEYYTKISPFLLPFLKDRPIMLHRFPDGIEGVDFYQKDMSSTHPEWIKTCDISHNGKIDHYLLINDLESLLYAVNLGSIEIHPFISRQSSLENPDYCVIDLDPHDISFTQLVEVALYIHEILDNAKVRHYCKTSGAKGLHICIPLHAKYSYEQSKQFAEIIALNVNKNFPSFTSFERNPKKRSRKIYLDCLQNRKGQTIIAPYSVRPQLHASVSTPLLWEEVNENLDPSKFNIKTIFSRLSTKKDVFKPVLGAGINMKIALAKLKSMFG